MNKKIFLHLFFALVTTSTINSMEFPPTTFSWENFSTIKKLLHAAFVSENLQICPEIDNLIAKKLLELHNRSDISFILPYIFKHNQYIDGYRKNRSDLERKDQFLDKSLNIYDSNNNNTEPLYIIDEDHYRLAHKNNFAICDHKGIIGLYDIETKAKIKLSDKAPRSKYFYKLSPNDQYVAWILNHAICLVKIDDINNIQTKELPHNYVRYFAFSPDSTKLITGADISNGTIIQWNIENMQNITNTTLLQNIICRDIIFNQDGEHLFINAHATEDPQHCPFIININKPLEKKALPLHVLFVNGDAPAVFTNNSDFILCRNNDIATCNVRHTIYTKQGDCIYSKLMQPHVTLDWDTLSSALHSKQHIIDVPSKITPNLTTAQLMLLDRICVQAREIGETIIIAKNSITAKTLESFGPNKEFIQKNLLITEK